MIPGELIKIDATTPGDGLAESLAIKGTKVAPQHINASHIQPVIDVGSNGFSYNGRIGGVNPSNVAINGVAGKDLPLIAPMGFATGGQSTLISASKQNARIIGAHCVLIFDAAGAVAFAGKVVQLTWSIQDVALGIGAYLVNGYLSIVATRLRYYLLIPCADKVIIPFDCALFATVTSEDATVFPANTKFAVTGQVWQRKVGAALPF